MIDRGAEAEHIQGLWRMEELAVLQRIADAEAIVRELAEDGPFTASYGYTDLECAICKAGVAMGGRCHHDPTCAFRRAVEWVAAHPAPEGSE